MAAPLAGGVTQEIVTIESPVLTLVGADGLSGTLCTLRTMRPSTSRSGSPVWSATR